MYDKPSPATPEPPAEPRRRGRGARPPRPKYDIVALRAKLGRPSYGDRLRAAARRAAKENPAASRTDSFERAAKIAGPLPRVRGRKLSRTEARARRKRYVAVLGSALDACLRLRLRRDAGAGRTRHRRTSRCSAPRRRGSRRGSGARGDPDDGGDEPEPPSAGGDPAAPRDDERCWAHATLDEHLAAQRGIRGRYRCRRALRGGEGL